MEREAELLKDWKPSADGIDPLDRLCPNGRLLRVEMAAASPHAEPLSRALFAALDTDKDGKVSKEEARAAEKVLLAKFDADGDDCLTPLEIVPDLLTREPTKSARPPRVKVTANAPADAGYGALEMRFEPRFYEQSDPFLVQGGLQITFTVRPVVARPEVPKSLLRPGREKELARFEAVAAEVVTLTVRPQPRGWFELLDANGDGQLSIRELRATEKVLLGTPDALNGTLALPDFTSGNAVSVIISPGVATPPPMRLTKAAPSARGAAPNRVLGLLDPAVHR